MKRFKYSCNGGALALGNETFTCHYMNSYGDGTHHVYIKDRNEQFPGADNRSFYDLYHFEGSIEGVFNVYNYDCLSKSEWNNKENILITLTGRYGVYSMKDKYSGDMLLEKWED